MLGLAELKLRAEEVKLDCNSFRNLRCGRAKE